MADCVSNAAELVVELRALSGCLIYGDQCDECGKEDGHERKFCRNQQETMFAAADAIEALLVENAKLKAERDAAVEDLKFADKNCRFCKWYDKNYAKGRYCSNNDGCGYGTDSRWEWRGIKEEEDATERKRSGMRR